MLFTFRTQAMALSDEVGGQVIVSVLGNENRVAILKQARIPMVHVAGVEAVEVVETQAIRPAVKGSGHAAFPRGRIVVLADPRSHVAILAKRFRDGAGAAGDDRRVPVIAGRDLADHAGRHRVVVAARQERGPGRAAEGCGMETIEAQSLGGQFVHRGRGGAPAKGVELSEPGIVDQDQHDVRRAFGCLHGLRELRLVGFQIGAPDVAIEVGIGTGQGLRSAGGLAWRGGFLGGHRDRDDHDQ